MKRWVGWQILAFVLLVGLSGNAWAQWSQPAPAPNQPGQYPGAPQPGDPGAPLPGAYGPPYGSDPVSPESQDSGRGLEWVWLDGQIGYQGLWLGAFDNEGLLDGDRVADSASGLSYGAGLGMRLIAFTLGARFRLASTSEWDLWTLNAEAGFHVPLGNLEPYVTLGAGYASLGAFSDVDLGGVSAEELSGSGYNVRLGGGLDYYISPRFSVGGAITAELLGLSRSALEGADAEDETGAIYAEEGSGLGLGATLALALGLHF